MPGLLPASRDFFRNYKVPRGGKYNIFGFDGKAFKISLVFVAAAVMMIMITPDLTAES